jgi:hypothetical protein
LADFGRFPEFHEWWPKPHVESRAAVRLVSAFGYSLPAWVPPSQAEAPCLSSWKTPPFIPIGRSFHFTAEDAEVGPVTGKLSSRLIWIAIAMMVFCTLGYVFLAWRVASGL